MAETRVLTQYDAASKSQKKFSPLTHVDSVFYEDGTFLGDKLTDLDARLLEGYTFIGRAKFDTNPGIPRSKVYYIATEVGTYTYFKEKATGATPNKSIQITKEGTYAFMFDPNSDNGLWVNEELQLHLTTDKVYDNPTATQLSESLITSVSADIIDNVDQTFRDKVLTKGDQKLSPTEQAQVRRNIGIENVINTQNTKINEVSTRLNEYHPVNVNTSGEWAYARDTLPKKGIKDGFRYWCTNKNSPESFTPGVEIIWEQTHWADSLGRIIDDNYPLKYLNTNVFEEIVPTASITQGAAPSDGVICYLKSAKKFVLRASTNNLYYASYNMHLIVGETPIGGKTYTNGTNVYIGMNGDLVKITTEVLA